MKIYQQCLCFWNDYQLCEVGIQCESCPIKNLEDNFKKLIQLQPIQILPNISYYLRVLIKKSFRVRLQCCCIKPLKSASNKLSKNFSSSLWIKSLHNQLASSLLTTCSRLVIIKPSRSKRCERILISA